jgi:hypothetical protein
LPPINKKAQALRDLLKRLRKIANKKEQKVILAIIPRKIKSKK